MMDEYSKSLMFSEDDVQDWCETHGDPNPIHTDEEEAEESLFGERVVPGLMLLSEVSGMLTALGEDDETIILAGVTAARFRDPVLLDEHINIYVKKDTPNNQFTPVQFEARAQERDSLVATGVLSIVVK